MFILASASPRRRELLKKIIPEFTIIPSSVDETIPDNIPAMDVAEFLSTKKAMDVSKSHPNDIVIASDTIIVMNDKVFGKPINENDARNMLLLFSNNKHYVVTGVCVMSKQRTISFSSINEVEFYNLSEQEIENYLKNDEYKDKAGSYAIQGNASLFVKQIKGDYNSIVGLPVSQLYRVLKNFFNF